MRDSFPFSTLSSNAGIQERKGHDRILPGDDRFAGRKK